MGDLYDPAAVEQSGTQVGHDRFHICILADAMSERDVSCGTCRNGNGNASDIRFVCVQCAHIFVSVFIGCCCFKVKCDDGCIADICVDFLDASDSLVILHIVLLCHREGRQRTAAPVRFLFRVGDSNVARK